MLPQWKRNLYFVWLTNILCIAGFSFALPFIPLYIQELGITDQAQIRFWAGLLLSISGACMALMAPIWGLLADRWGRKIMMLRAFAAGAIILVLMGIINSIAAVLVLRILQGLTTGTVTASLTLVAAGTPRKHLSYALGFASSSTFIGFAFGPLVGGIVAELLGYRRAFFIGGLIVLVGFVLVLVFIRDVRADDRQEYAQSNFKRRHLLKQPFLLLFLLIFLIKFCRVLPFPFVPLFVQEMRAATRGTAVITGLITASAGIMTALAGLTLVRLGDRKERLSLVTLFLGLAALISLPLFFSPGLAVFALVYPLAYFFLGAVEPLIQSQLSSHVPSRNRGIAMGVQTTAGSLGWFAGPLLGSSISITLSIRHVFLFFSLFLFVPFAVAAIERLIRFRKGSSS